MGQGTTETTSTREGTGGTTAAGGQPQSLGWRAGLPVELQEHEWLKGFSKVGEFATAALALKERSEKAIVPPGENATETERQAYFKALGVPEREDGYALEVPKPPDGIEPTAEFLADFKKLASKARLTNDQAKSIFQALYGKVYDTLVAQKKAQAEEEAKEAAQREKVKKELGEEKIKQAAELVAGIPIEGLVEEMDGNGLGDSPKLIAAFAWLRQQISPDKLVKGTAPAASGPPPEVPGKPTPLRYPWMKEFYGKSPE